MSRILVYLENPSSADIRCLRAILGECPEIPKFPIVSDPIDSDSKIQSIQQQLNSLSESTDKTVVIVVPDELSSMTSDDAIRLIKSHHSWKELLESFEIDSQQVRFQMSEHARFWVVAAFAADAGIPPGVGFLVDKFSKRVFPRRLVDLYDDDRKLM